MTFLLVTTFIYLSATRYLLYPCSALSLYHFMETTSVVYWLACSP